MRVVIRISRDKKRPRRRVPPPEPAREDLDLRGVWCLGCGSRYVKTSRRRGLIDLAFFVAGYFPFRCLTCGLRFHFRAPRA